MDGFLLRLLLADCLVGGVGTWLFARMRQVQVSPASPPFVDRYWRLLFFSYAIGLTVFLSLLLWHLAGWDDWLAAALGSP